MHDSTVSLFPSTIIYLTLEDLQTLQYVASYIMFIAIIRIQGFNTNGGFDYSVSANRKGLTNSIGVNVQIS